MSILYRRLRIQDLMCEPEPTPEPEPVPEPEKKGKLGYILMGVMCLILKI